MPNTTYSYTVASYDAAGNNSAQSSPLSVTTVASTSTCFTAYAQGNCFGYVLNTQVSSGGHNWTCTNGNCSQCSAYSSCTPGGTGCPWGIVWTDNGVCK